MSLMQELVPDLTGTAQSAKNAVKKPAKPATFQCELCPKRFTRAHNLRDHLRTHLDERPFVCISCSRAFTRRHDLNTHAALHLNEKKYVCAGVLRSGVRWGCGRKFDRQRNLKRHFKTEKGRSCVRTLLEEEREFRASSSSEQLNPLVGSEVAQPAIDNNYNVDTDAAGLVKSQSYVSFSQLSGLTHLGLPSSRRVASEAEDQGPPSPPPWTPLRIEIPPSVKISDALGDSSSITRSQNHGMELNYPNPAFYDGMSQIDAPGNFDTESLDIDDYLKLADTQTRLRCLFQGCDHTSRTKSDYRKHEARHQRAHICLVYGCSRTKGFATIDDLKRHRKSVHNIGPKHGQSLEYKCFGKDCLKRERHWPRFDNFKHHLQRMHADESLERLISLSNEWYVTEESATRQRLEAQIRSGPEVAAWQREIA